MKATTLREEGSVVGKEYRASLVGTAPMCVHLPIARISTGWMMDVEKNWDSLRPAHFLLELVLKD